MNAHLSEEPFDALEVLVGVFGPENVFLMDDGDEQPTPLTEKECRQLLPGPGDD